jgi:hypothetical protein
MIKAAGRQTIRTVGRLVVLPGAVLFGLAHAGAPGTPTPSPGDAMAGAPSALTGAQIANAEVRVTSSVNGQYRGMTNTDAQGRFSLAGVPAGGINVHVWRNGALIAHGAAVIAGDLINEAQLLHIELVSPETQPKSGLESR